MAEITSVVRALDQRIPELGKAAYALFAHSVPEAGRWSDQQKASFVGQARGRFSAMLAIVDQGTTVDEALISDLEDVGSTTALSHASLTQLLTVLRISRDILLANAIHFAMAEKDGEGIVSSFSERLLPAVDGMIDAISTGYWSTTLSKYADDNALFSSVVQHAAYPIYEVDIDGKLRLANVAFCQLVGKSASEVLGERLGDVVRVAQVSPQGLEGLMAEHPGDRGTAEIILEGLEGNPLHVEMVVRRSEGRVMGFAGIMTPSGQHAVSFLDQERTSSTNAPDFADLRAQIAQLYKTADSLTDAGRFLADHADGVTSRNVQVVANAMEKQGDRLRQSIEELDRARQEIELHVNETAHT